MRHGSCLLITICMVAGLAISATKTSRRISASEEANWFDVQYRASMLNQHNKLVDDIDTALAHITTLETATGGESADSLYKTAVKGARVRGDSVIGTGSQYTRLRADSSIITAQVSTRSRPSYLIADSIKIASGSNIKELTISDGTKDTLVITIGAKTWKFLPVADQ